MCLNLDKKDDVKVGVCISYAINLRIIYINLYKTMLHQNTPPQDNIIKYKYYPHLAVLRTKPFMLLAGISGTGKSRIVRKLAQAT